MFSNKTYDVLKTVATLVLPAIATLWLSLVEIWGIPYGTQIGSTIVALNTALGVVLGISNAKYKKNNEKEGE